MSKAAVLDASALLAVLGEEPGGELVEPLLDGGVISTVNWSEVMGRYSDLGLGTAGRAAEIESLGVSLSPFTSRQAEIAAGLLPHARQGCHSATAPASPSRSTSAVGRSRPIERGGGSTSGWP